SRRRHTRCYRDWSSDVCSSDLRERPVGGIWLTFGLALLLAVPGLLALASGQAPEDGEPSDQVKSRAAISAVLGRTHDAETVAEALLAQVEELAGIELAGLLLVDYDTRTVNGCAARVNGRPLDWFPDIRIDLDNEPSGVATAVHEASAFAVYDARSSKIVSRRMVEATGAKSVAFVPLIAAERVIAVLVAGAVSNPRAFASEELTLLQAIAGEAALALDRTRSNRALAEALERERFAARLSARVRSELDIEHLLRVAVQETGTALGVDRCFIRLGRLGGIPTAQWQAPGLAPIESSRHLAVSNLATRRHATVAIEDVA